MLYLNTKHIQEIGNPWPRLIDAVEDSVKALARSDFSQPIKPYLRYRDPVNRIIAMPAFVGEPFEVSGIKWIASFPKNIDHGIKRAHSVTILNEAEHGRPFATFNTALISGLRTAAVTGMITRRYMDQRDLNAIKVGMTGFGPIGRLHLDMMANLYGDRIDSFNIYDIRPVDRSQLPANIKVNFVDNWRDAYVDADIFITCTVSDAAYVDLPPKPGALLNNVSLRDFKPEVVNHVKWMLVDDWDEVCREATDIEIMHQTYNLQREDTLDMIDLVGDKNPTFATDETVMFNPMGLAVFDMAAAKVYYDIARERGIGVVLED